MKDDAAGQNRQKMRMALAGGLLSFAFFALGLVLVCSEDRKTGAASGGVAYAESAARSAASARAFLKAYRVLSHPRCVNCHPDGDVPLVGDKSLPHPMSIRRGPEGMGQNGLWCSTCHPDRNLPGAHLPPGAPGWQLPTRGMPMVFEKKSARQLCEQLKDPARNGERTPGQIVEHVRDAPLVLWGWDPGDGRTRVPVPHQEFVEEMTTWAEKGAACPEN